MPKLTEKDLREAKNQLDVSGEVYLTDLRQAGQLQDEYPRETQITYEFSGWYKVEVVEDAS